MARTLAQVINYRIGNEHAKNDSDDDWDDDDSWGEGPQLTSDRLNKIETALEDELDLRGNGFETTRESGGGMGGWEGPMQIMDKNADFDDEDNYITLSVGSSNNDGKMSIVFANYNGEPYFEPDYDALTGDNDLEPQQAYKVTKALMKMPEVGYFESKLRIDVREFLARRSSPLSVQMYSPFALFNPIFKSKSIDFFSFR